MRTLLVDIYPPNLEAFGTPRRPRGPRCQSGARDIDVLMDLDPAPSVISARCRRDCSTASPTSVCSTPSGTPAPATRTLTLRDDQDAAVLEISDDGIGFDPDAAMADPAHGHFGLRVLTDLARSRSRAVRRVCSGRRDQVAAPRLKGRHPRGRCARRVVPEDFPRCLRGSLWAWVGSGWCGVAGRLRRRPHRRARCAVAGRPGRVRRHGTAGEGQGAVTAAIQASPEIPGQVTASTRCRLAPAPHQGGSDAAPQRRPPAGCASAPRCSSCPCVRTHPSLRPRDASPAGPARPVLPDADVTSVYLVASCRPTAE